MKGIIFDFNGTLYWDSKLHYEAWREFSALLREHPFTDEEMREKMFGHTNADIIEYLIGRKPSKEMVDTYGKQKEAVYRKRCLLNAGEFKLALGAVELLDYLKDNDIPRAIATMSEWENVEFYINEFHLDKWFDLDKIVYSDGTIPGKPAPDIFKIAAERIHIAPQDCIVIEDAIAGIQSAMNAGIGKIIAIASIEPIEFYQSIPSVSQIITNFYEFDRGLLEIPTKLV